MKSTLLAKYDDKNDTSISIHHWKEENCIPIRVGSRLLRVELDEFINFHDTVGHTGKRLRELKLL